MSRENAEALRSLYEHWAEGDFSAGADLYDSDVEFVIGPGFPDTGTYHGLEGVLRYTRLFLEPWTRLTIEAEETIEAGDRFFVAVCQRGMGTGSGAVTDFRYFHVWTFRDGRVVHWQNYRERDEALVAAGVEQGS